MRRATTVFNRFNFTIMAIKDLSTPVPTHYNPQDFFVFYDTMFALNQSQPNWYLTTEYMLLIAITSYLGADLDTQRATGSDDRLFKLKEFLAVPIFLFNNVAFGGGGPTPDMGKSVTLAIPSYKEPSRWSKAHYLVNNCSIHPLHFCYRRSGLIDLVFYGLGVVSTYSNSKHISVSRHRYCVKRDRQHGFCQG
jgi:hypothetical protein